jgi:quinol monooxygenase YgiN
MIVMKLELTVSDTSFEPVHRTLRNLIGPAEVQSGCLGCRLTRAPKKENTLVYTEIWDTESEVKSRVRSAHFRKILDAMEYSNEQPDLRFFQMNDARGMDVIEQVLGGLARDSRPLFGE